ncbi:MAG TPA: glutaredoxin domain-containing protein [Polyangia bacterium]|nr:glutaredoxin domain-containing protein [Polyangia bacterium]
MMKNNARVVVYATSWCGYSHAAESLLKREGIPFELIDVSNDPRTRAELVERAHGRRTVPVIFVDGEAIGGYQELAAMVREGKLEHLAHAA